jgi:hypothetical protein
VTGKRGRKQVNHIDALVFPTNLNPFAVLRMHRSEFSVGKTSMVTHPYTLHGTLCIALSVEGRF